VKKRLWKDGNTDRKNRDREKKEGGNGSQEGRKEQEKAPKTRPSNASYHENNFRRAKGGARQKRGKKKDLNKEKRNRTKKKNHEKRLGRDRVSGVGPEKNSERGRIDTKK